jgi:hypothetical protein
MFTILILYHQLEVLEISTINVTWLPGKLEVSIKGCVCLVVTLHNISRTIVDMRQSGFQGIARNGCGNGSSGKCSSHDHGVGSEQLRENANSQAGWRYTTI